MRPLAAVLPQDVMTRAILVATTIFRQGLRMIVLHQVLIRKLWGQCKSSANDLNRAQPFQTGDNEFLQRL